MKIAIVHDYLNQRGGAERVVGVMHEMFPEAPIYTLFINHDQLWPALRGAWIIPSFLQKIPFVERHFKLFFWLYPFVIKTIRVRDCDLVLSSSSAYAKGVRVRTRSGKKPVHICYCYTPMRFAWDFDGYIAEQTQNRLLLLTARAMIPFLKWWDIRNSRGVDLFIAVSTAVQHRIANCYGRTALVIPPAVEILDRSAIDGRSVFAHGLSEGDFFLIVSRLVAYKALDLAVRACTETGMNLVVIGQGPDRERLQRMAGPTVRFLGWQPDEVVRDFMVMSTALIFPGEEDFGITPLEVNGLGTPVVAFQAGGALDTVVHGVNGVFFPEPTVTSLVEALNRVKGMSWDPVKIREHAARFARKEFERQLAEVIHGIANHGLDSGARIPMVEQGGLPL